MKKALLSILLWPLLALALWAQAPVQADPLAQEIGQITAELDRISGLRQLRPIDYERIPKAGVKAFLERRIQEALKPEQIRTEELALKKLGFVPPDFDLKKTIIDLLSEQAAAFYDLKKKKLFLIDGGADFLQHAALVHELAHALADQHFHLDKFVEAASQNDDSALARLAVVEGQATWLMSEYLTRGGGQSLRDLPLLARLMARAGESSFGQFPMFDQAPLYLRVTLVFPYSQGMLFQQAVIEKRGRAAFTEVFRNPPLSTQQILHPEKYLAGEQPLRPPLPQIENQRAYKTVTDGALGELDHAVLIRQYAGEQESEALAPELRGGFFRLLESAGHRIVLLYASEWSGEQAARRFFAAYEKVLRGKWKACTFESRSPEALAGRGDDGYFLVRLQGARVTSVEGLPSREKASNRPEGPVPAAAPAID
jgi:hypothetical protein